MIYDEATTKLLEEKLKHLPFSLYMKVALWDLFCHKKMGQLINLLKQGYSVSEAIKTIKKK